MARKKPEIEEIDDGKVVAPMNLEGMPWYRPDKPKSNQEDGSGGSMQPAEKLTAAEKMAFFWGALKAAMLVTLVFFGAFAIVILIILWIGQH